MPYFLSFPAYKEIHTSNSMFESVLNEIAVGRKVLFQSLSQLLFDNTVNCRAHITWLRYSLFKNELKKIISKEWDLVRNEQL